MLSHALLRIITLAVALPSPASALWPVPRSLETGDKVLYIDQTLKVTYNGGNVRWKSAPDPSYRDYAQDAEKTLNMQLPYTYDYTPRSGPNYDSKDIVQGALSRAFTAIFRRNLVPWVLHDRGEEYEPDVYAGDKTWISSLAITQTEKDEKSPYKLLAEEWDESYTLSISEDGEAEIEAATSIGIIRALETFSQLFWQHSTGTFLYTNLAPLSV